MANFNTVWSTALILILQNSAPQIFTKAKAVIFPAQLATSEGLALNLRENRLRGRLWPWIQETSALPTHRPKKKKEKNTIPCEDVGEMHTFYNNLYHFWFNVREMEFSSSHPWRICMRFLRHPVDFLWNCINRLSLKCLLTTLCQSHSTPFCYLYSTYCIYLCNFEIVNKSTYYKKNTKEVIFKTK